ncbi:MAG: adenylyltransferase/cytidyltransferase family protein [Candidatus Doudnabacteria bacterium]|nr:adenylyltransferase/cytidyltransferase family protein [Candidatus Doudnabacteria bacterium]
MSRKPLVVAVSGGFDPVHVGHIELFREAKKLGDRLVVILNNDHWLKKKKGYVFMPELQRKAVLEAIRHVDEVILTSHPENPDDMSVCAELEKIRPEIFANGGDRNEMDAANPKSSLYKDIGTCRELGIKMVFNVGGKKAQSSSELVKKIRDVS